MSAIDLWWLALALAAVVIVVVAVLLGLIIAAAKSIDRHAAGIWNVGKEIAGNTVSIWMLDRTNDLLRHMVEALQQVQQETLRLERSVEALAQRRR